MRLENIVPQNLLTDSTQEEAVSNIQGAAAVGTSPESFKDLKPDLQPELDKLSMPPLATPVVARNVATSPEHAAAISPNVDNLNWMEKWFGTVGNSVNRVLGPERELKDLNWKKLNGLQEEPKTGNVFDTIRNQQNEMFFGGGKNSFSEEDDLRLTALRMDSETNYGMQDYGAGPWATIPAEVIAAGVDIPANIARNKELFGSIVAAEASIGGTYGSSAGIPGAIAGTTAGALLGVGTGWLATSFVQNYKDSAALTYNELDRATRQVGEPGQLTSESINIDEQTKRDLSHGVGLVSGSLQYVTDKYLLKSVPFLKDKLFSPSGVREILSNPANDALKKALISIGKTLGGAAAGASSNALQQTAQIVAEEVGQTYNDGEVSFTNGLMNAAEKIATNEKNRGTQVAQAAEIGAATGGTFAAAGQIYQRGVADQINARRGGEPGQMRDVTPPDQPLLPSSDMHASSPALEQVAHVLEFQDVLESTSKVAQNTKLYDLSKPMVSDLRRQMLEESGTKYVYLDKEEMQAYAGNEEKAKKLLSLVDPAGRAQAEINAPIRVEASKFADLVDDDPGISEIVKLSPEGPSPKTAKEYAERQKQLAQARLELQAKLGFNEKSPEERAYSDAASKITPDMSEQTLTNILGSKEVAQAYLDRLDVNAVPEKDSLRPFKTNIDFQKEKLAEAEKALEDIKKQGSKVTRIGDGKQLDIRDAEATVELKKRLIQDFEQKAKPHLDKLADIALMRERVTSLRDQLPTDVESKQIMEQALKTPQPINDIFNEADYLDQSTFTKEIEGVMTKDEVERFNALELEGKKEVVKNINESAIYEMNQVVDITREISEEAFVQKLQQQLESDPNLAIVDKFRSIEPEFYKTERYQKESDLTAAHHKKGFSIFAIDPTTLTDSQKTKYAKDKQIRKHKGFVKGGLSVDDAAELLGAGSGDNLLRILSTTPTRKEVIETQKVLNKDLIERDARAMIDLDHTAIAQAYHNKARNDLTVMKFMVDKSWAVSKKGIKRIALPVPTLQELRNQAELAVSHTPIGALSVNQFKVGERKSQRLALTKFLNGDFVGAAINKKASALNTELTLATMKGIADVNRAQRFSAKFNTSDVQQELKHAGKYYTDAADEIRTVYNLNGKSRDQAKQGSFAKFVDQQIKAGNGDFAIPKEFADPRPSFKDMTVEEARTVHQRLQNILHQARLKNELYNKFGPPGQKQKALDAFIAAEVPKLEKHPDYNPKKAVAITGRLSPLEKFSHAMDDTASRLRNMDFILLHAANDDETSPLMDISAMIHGTGEFKNQGFNAKGDRLVKAETRIKEIAKAFGEKEWDGMMNHVIYVDEFKAINELNNGVMRESDLFMMRMNTGNEGNLERLTNYGISKDLISQVLDKYLERKHAVAAQALWDHMEEYWPEVQELQKRTGGHLAEKVPAIPVVQNGETFRGGWFPIITRSEMDIRKARKRFKDLSSVASGEEAHSLSDNFFAEEMTKDGHTKERTSNTLPLSLQMNGIGMAHENIAHDLSFREAIADSLKLLLHPELGTAIASVVGKSDHNVLLDTLVNVSGSVAMNRQSPFDPKEMWAKIASHIRGGIHAGYLVYRAQSLTIQSTSLALASKNLGKTGTKQLLSVLATMSTNPQMVPEFYRTAGEINPSIKRSMEGIEDNTQQYLQRSSLPRENTFKKLKRPLDLLRHGNEVGFKALAQVDQVQKVAVTHAAYLDFLNGDVKGWPLKRLNKLSSEERNNKAAKYATTVARTSLTTATEADKAPFQRDDTLENAFFNDARNVINNIERQARKIRHAAQSGNQEFANAYQAGTTEEKFQSAKSGGKDYGRAGIYAAQMLMTSMALRFIADTIIALNQGQPTPYAQLQEMPEGEKAKAIAWYMASSPAVLLAEHVPYLRNIAYSIGMEQKYGKPKDVQPLAAKVQTDIKNVLNVGINFMDLIDGRREVSRKEAKSLGFVGSYITPGGLPVNAGFSLYNSLGSINVDDSAPSLINTFVEKFDSFKKSQEDADSKDKVSEDQMKALEDIRAQVAPQPSQGS